MPWWRRPYFELKVLAVWIFLIYERLGIAFATFPTASRTIISPSIGAEALRLRTSMSVNWWRSVLAENNFRRLAPYDQRLKRPRFVPFIVRLALKFIGPKKVKDPKKAEEKTS